MLPTHDPITPAWLPHRVRRGDGGWVVDWCDVGGERFAEPHFDQTIYRIETAARRTMRTTPLAALAGVRSAARPRGFILHTSRCGSTLITKMLDALPGIAAFSEPAIFEAILRERIPDARSTTTLLQAAAAAFAACNGDGRGTFIKLTARAVVDHARIVQALPAVPLLFVYRDPIEVLVSLVGTFARRLPPGLNAAGLLDASADAIAAMRPAEFWARVLARQCAAALELHGRARVMFVNYSELPDVVWTAISAWFDLAPDADDIARMRETFRHRANNPQHAFRDDRAEKTAAATDEIREMADRFVRPHYEHLETLRLPPRRDS